MIEPNDVMKVDDENWEEFKKEAAKDELYYNGPGDILDTPEGRAKFCRLNESSVFRKPDPEFPGSKIWVFNLKGQGLVIKKRSRVDPTLMEDVEYNAGRHRGKQVLRTGVTTSEETNTAALGTARRDSADNEPPDGALHSIRWFRL